MLVFNTEYKCGHVLKCKRRTRHGQEQCREYARNNACPICYIVGNHIGTTRPYSPKEKRTLEQLKQHLIVWVG